MSPWNFRHLKMRAYFTKACRVVREKPLNFSLGLTLVLVCIAPFLPGFVQYNEVTYFGVFHVRPINI